jgi:DnaK suppressor protein
MPRATAAKTSKKTKASATPEATSAASADGSGTAAVDQGFVEAQRAQLLAEREAYARSADSLKAEAEQLAEDREPGDVQFDEESGEGDSMNVERERDLALSAQAMESIEAIDRALVKVDQGTYGVCERCGQPIPEERLKALPHASMCVRCKSGGLGRR